MGTVRPLVTDEDKVSSGMVRWRDQTYRVMAKKYLKSRYALVAVGRSAALNTCFQPRCGDAWFSAQLLLQRDVRGRGCWCSASAPIPAACTVS
jgi:hypothetical protein